MEPVTYRRRRSAIARGEREWRVEQRALVSRTPSGAEQRIEWRDIVSVRLCCAPMRRRPWRYVFELQQRNGRKIQLDNAHYVGPGDYEERSAAYVDFVRAAAARIAAENPKARALIGETPKRYFFLVLVGMLAIFVAALALAAAPAPDIVKLVALLLMLPAFGWLVLRVMPRGVPVDAIPARALPHAPCGRATDED
ncbi:MAG: hypothetical protein AB7G05_15180 [Hyphomonadaceae bacterium]